MTDGYFCEQTEYSGLYRNTSWGMLPWHNRPSDLDMKAIFKHRNHFAEEFHLKSRWYKPSLALRFWFALSPHRDHLEHYRTEDGGVVLVVSPYDRDISGVIPSAGWREYDNLYVFSARSFIRVFPSSQALRTDAIPIIDALMPERPSCITPAQWEQYRSAIRSTLLRSYALVSGRPLNRIIENILPDQAYQSE